MRKYLTNEEWLDRQEKTREGREKFRERFIRKIRKDEENEIYEKQDEYNEDYW